MNRYQKLLYATAISAVLAGGIAPVFSASADVAVQSIAASGGSGKTAEADAAPAVSRSPDTRSNQDTTPSSYSLHSALLRAPTSPAALPRQ